MANFVSRFVRDEEGATMVEYGIMVALIAVVSILMIGSLGKEVLTTFTNVYNELKTANTP